MKRFILSILMSAMTLMSLMANEVKVDIDRLIINIPCKVKLVSADTVDVHIIASEQWMLEKVDWTMEGDSAIKISLKDKNADWSTIGIGPDNLKVMVATPKKLDISTDKGLLIASSELTKKRSKTQKNETHN